MFKGSKIQFHLILLLAVVATVRGVAAVQPPEAPPHISEREIAQGFSDTRILAKPRAGAARLAEAAEARERMNVRRSFDRFGGLRVLELDGTLAPAEAIARLRATGHYEFVEPDFIRFASVIPNDPRFAEQWSLNNTGAGGGIAGSDIKAPAGWDIRSTAPSVIVAVIDSGIRATHQDIAANLWINPGENPVNGIDDDGNGYIDDANGINSILARGTFGSGNPADDTGHGSHVAGIIGAVGNNGTGITGVAWSTSLMALKFLGSNGTGLISDAIECIDYAIAKGAHVINASYGATDPKNFSQSEVEAIRRARDAGIVFVAAAGNSSLNMDVSRAYPASYPVENIIAVGNSTRLDDTSTTSNFGSGAVELFAPGSEILSLGHRGDSTYEILSGTSMAAPHVAGAIALLKAQFPGDNYRGLINRLLRGVQVKEAFAGKAQTRGRLDLAVALATTTNRPFNDDFANRAIIRGNNFAVRSSNQLGTREPGEPTHAGATGGASLWWSWTPAASASVTFDTSGSGFDTMLAVYTGTSVASLTQVAANDNTTGVTSRLELTVQAGTPYQIAIDGKNGAIGLALLNIGSVPLNDNFAGVQDVSGESVLVKTTNANASREPNEPLILGFAGGRSLWYRWTAPSTKRYQISAFSEDVDTLAAIYTGSSLATLSLVTSSDNVGAEPSALCTIDATAGTVYHITLDAKDSLSGEIAFTIVDSLWQFTTSDSITGSPAIAPDGTIYVGSTDNFLHALSPSGAQLWRYQTGGFIDTCSPAIGPDGTVYSGSADGFVYALNPNGTLRWRSQTGGPVSNSPAIASDGTIYIKSDDNFLYALSPSTGNQLWRFNTQGITYASPVIAPDGTIYVGSGNNRFFAVNPNGTQKWSFTADGDTYATAALDSAGNVYFGTLTGRLYSLTPAGTQRWSFLPGGPMSSSPALSADGGTVYFGSYDRKLHAINTANGIARWAFDLTDEVRASSPLVAANGVIYIGCYDSRLQAVNPDGTLRRFYATGQRIRSSPVIVGTTLYVGSNDRKLYALPVGVGPGTGPWAVYRHNQQRTGRSNVDPNAVNITSQPQSQTVTAGSVLTLSVTTNGATPTGFQWFKGGNAIAGATGSTFTIPAATPADSGSYHVVVTGPSGTVTSATAIIFVPAPGGEGRIVNISVRSPAGTGAETLIVGFIIGGPPADTLQLLIRASGPSLAQFGVSNTLADPKLTIFDGNTAILSNDNWGGDLTIAAHAGFVGAFPFISNTSKDAALLSTLPARAFTAHVTASDGGTGVTLAEVYDASFGIPSTRLLNISARTVVGTGDNVLIAGFVIRDQPRTVLIRAVGPTLAQFGVPGVLANPRLELHSGQTKLSENDNWNAADAARFSQVGAFSLPVGSLDSVIVAQLAPGAYTAVVSGVGGTSGVALVEVYVLP